MGVKDLWPILSPVCEKRSLWELQNKVIAIDLSAWICDSNCLAKQPQVNMYLRNLFFRTSYLLLLGAKPVFVLEGKPPVLKAKTMNNRLKKSGSSENGVDHKVPKRSRLKSLQKQCVELLSYLGVSCVEAPGEAEAHCAHLNEQGLVDGVISQDSDAFLYGAKKVYRNFQMAPKYTYDAYSIDKIEEKLGLTRTKLIGYSLLCGSDYNNGVHRIGKELAVKFLTSIPDEVLYQRFLQWKYGANISRKYQDLTLDARALELEKAVKEKAVLDEDFPNLEVVAEFNTDPGPLRLDYQWSKPDICKFIVLAIKKLQWDEEYSTKKMVPLVGRWHLENGGDDCGLRIQSIGPAHGKSTHFKVTWDLFDVTTLESKESVQLAYPELVAQYEENLSTKSNAKGGKKSQKRKTNKSDEPSIDDKLPLIDDNQTPATTLLNYFLPERPITMEPMDTLLSESEDSNYLNLSSIIQEIVTRPNSNPAVDQLHHLV